MATARSFTGGGTVVGASERRGANRELRVRLALSEQAAAYDAAGSRIVGYLRRALSDAFSVTFERVGDVALGAESAYRAMTSMAWPRRVAADSAARLSTADVNLLITDGEMDTCPTGMGVPYLAAVGGARDLNRLPPATETEAVVPYSERFRVAQVAVHEVGHALRLHHDHGTVVREGESAVVSPMVSTYPWAPPRVRAAEFDCEESACGDPYPDVEGLHAQLGLTYSPCALRRLRERGEWAVNP